MLLGAAMSIISYGQTMEKSYYNHVSGADTCNKCIKRTHTRFMDGRALFVSGSLSTFTPGYAPLTYGSSFEAGVWGTTKSTSFSVVGDFMNNIDKKDTTTSISTSRLIGLKSYYTFYSTKTSCYMVYLSPKMWYQDEVGKGSTKTSMKGSMMLEVGLNPNYQINKYMLLSLSLSNQIYKDGEGQGGSFTKSIWHPGISIGVVIYR